jgi:cation-transporting ATPase E
MENVDLRVTEGIPSGLTSEEVQRLKAEGKVNKTGEQVGKSTLRIIGDNLLSYFNLIWAVVSVLLIITGSYKNLTFLLIVVPNILISVIQELRAKHTVEKLSVTTEPKATVIRDGKLETIDQGDVVLGDVMLLEVGRQVLADSVVISGFAEANESMLTGESDAIKKEVGDNLLAGSFLVSGSVYARATHVGRDNYMHKIEKSAKTFKAPSSNLFKELNKLIKSIGSIIIPMATVLFFSNWLKYEDLVKAVATTSASIVGMVPAGMYLLVTLTLTLAVINLSKKKTLVQDMYSIEMLASADVLCLDKTGTITDGTMTVTDVLSLSEDYPLEEIERIMSHVNGTESAINNTSVALISKFGKDVSVKIIKKIPFSSSRKFSAVSIEGLGCYSLGAPHFAPCPVSQKLDEEVSKYTSLGKRVILLSRHESLDEEGKPIALIAISDRIRPGAKETIAKFQEQGVTLKVISGDHAETVSKIAEKVGINNADKFISCENISDEELAACAEEYAVFGRVTPEQKVLLVTTLQKNGHTVAMTGDGVNDTLALKESNCAIAMADGSEMARKISQIVLMNSDFSSLPDIVHEGRRCINNVRLSSSLFLMKTIFTIFLSVLSVITFSGYPFEPSQFVPVELFIIGLGSILLTLEPNDKRIEGSFIKSLIIKSMPNAIAMLLPILALMIMEKFTTMSYDARNAIALSLVIAVAFINLFYLCLPFTKWRIFVISFVFGLLAISIPVSVFFLHDLFHLMPLRQNLVVFFIMLGVSAVATVVIQSFRAQIEKIIAKRLEMRELALKAAAEAKAKEDTE